MITLRTQKQLEEDLESDDELPSDYDETPDIPAYKNDGRFNPIRFPWLKKYLDKQKQVSKNDWKPFLYSNVNEQTVLEKTKHCNDKLLITQGVLTQGDILCLKCIERNCSDSMLLWLVNFLMYKDLQSNFNFLRTCLVDEISTKSYERSLDICSKVHNFEIVVEEGRT